MAGRRDVIEDFILLTQNGERYRVLIPDHCTQSDMSTATFGAGHVVSIVTHPWLENILFC